MKRGPKPKNPSETRSAPIGLRIPPQLYEELFAEAKKSGRSLSREIEVRLRLSLENVAQRELRERFGEELFWLFLLIANKSKHVERFTQKRWFADPFTYREVQMLIAKAFEQFKPPGTPRPPRHLRGQKLGADMARREIANVEAAWLDNNPPLNWNWGGMGFTEWVAAADALVPKLKKSPLREIYGIERKKKK
jgi:hypothetical protein